MNGFQNTPPQTFYSSVKRLAACSSLLGLLMLTGANTAYAQSCTSPASVGSETELNAAIACYNAESSGTFVANITQSFGLTASTTTISNASGAELQINGSSHLIDGAEAYRLFYVAAGSVSIDSLTLQNGSAETAPCNNHLCGGAILIDATATVAVSNSTFFNNKATDGGGGAILNKGTLTVSNSTFNQNTTRYGGAVYNYESKAKTTVTNSTFSGNSASGRLGTGGAIFHDEGTTTLNNVTVTANSAGRWGAGIYSNDGTVFLNNTIVAGNTDSYGGDTSAKECAKTGTRGKYTVASSLDSDASCGSATTSSSINLDSLKNNGGSTWTHALLAGSAAIHAGDATICAGAAVNGLDQRGVSRTNGPAQGLGCDIGAFEVEKSAPIITSDATPSVAENQTNAVDVNVTDDYSSEGSGLTFSLSGGADQALFSIDAATGVVTFKSAPDYEKLADQGTDNNYDIQILVTDADGLTVSQSFTISVTDVPGDEAPTITSLSAVSVAENQTSVVDVQATDDLNTEGNGLTFGKTGGADADLFALDTDSGVVTFVSAPDFEGSVDANSDNRYELQIAVTDANGVTTVQDIVVTVTDVAEAPTATDDSFEVTDGEPITVTTPGLLGNDQDPDGNALTAAVVSEPQNGTLTVNADGSFTYTPNADYGGTDSFTYLANDGSADSNTATVTIAVSAYVPQCYVVQA